MGIHTELNFINLLFLEPEPERELNIFSFALTKYPNNNIYSKNRIIQKKLFRIFQMIRTTLYFIRKFWVILKKFQIIPKIYLN